MKKHQILISLSLFIFVSSVFTASVSAKSLPRFNVKKTTAKASPASSGKASASKYITAKLRSDRRALLVTFKNLRDVKMIDYTLTYKSNGVDQGVTGTIDGPTESSLSRELVFGTESKGVYTYHTNITGMRFEVTITLKSGAKIKKAYTVKVK